MLSIIRKLLAKILDDIDAGNSNITEEEGNQIIEMLSSITDDRMSKYQACQYLNVSRATFDVNWHFCFINKLLILLYMSIK